MKLVGWAVKFVRARGGPEQPWCVRAWNFLDILQPHESEYFSATIPWIFLLTGYISIHADKWMQKINIKKLQRA